MSTINVKQCLHYTQSNFSTKYNKQKFLLKKVKSYCLTIDEIVTWILSLKSKLFIFYFLIIFLTFQLSIQQQSEQEMMTTIDPKKLPPSIYQWIEENAHICKKFYIFNILRKFNL